MSTSGADEHQWEVAPALPGCGGESEEGGEVIDAGSEAIFQRRSKALALHTRCAKEMKRLQRVADEAAKKLAPLADA